ncbi:hypothetical protein [Candidatus Albibeggiatoa sp. nov. BB20]|uniref:hypothetical protein n=1 Tax=Candidatus Albibeggiatoa sp. nov. BB20 TaxID=3162723 RepID=UPI00336536B3
MEQEPQTIIHQIQFPNDIKCREYLEGLQGEFETHLLQKVSERTARKHSVIIGLLIDFLCYDCALKNMNEITVGQANSYFRSWYNSKIGDATESEVKTAVKKFFVFLNTEKGFINEKLMKSFKRK